MKLLSILVFLTGLIGCATPAQRFEEAALKLGFNAEIVSTSQFQHKIYTSRKINNTDVLHVYLDGDGTPWVRNSWVAYDPTARNPLILHLMKQDKTPAILLGRPCYYGLNESPSCDSQLWTSGRYSEEVVNSMSDALNIWLAKHHFIKVVLIGYSGGGSISLLIAKSIKNIKKVVTFAGNLDIVKWCEFHDYPLLTNSLNPASQGVLPTEIKQFHFAGENDQIVPAFIIKDYANSQNNANYYLVPGNDHVCCWEKEWMKILETIK